METGLNQRPDDSRVLSGCQSTLLELQESTFKARKSLHVRSSANNFGEFCIFIVCVCTLKTHNNLVAFMLFLYIFFIFAEKNPE